MPAVPDAATEVSIDADDNETFGTAACAATGAAGATTVNERPGPSLWGTVARIVWPDDGTLTSNCDPGGLSSGHVTLTRWRTQPESRVSVSQTGAFFVESTIPGVKRDVVCRSPSVIH